jgi:DNA-binding NarL/FixJ family response regulator
MNSASVERVLLVVDRMPLRRAQLVRFLESWANEHRLGVAVSDISEIVELQHSPDLCIAILSIGAESLSEPRLTGAVRVLKALAPQAPVVVMSESSSVANVDCAVALGASGYIPASLEAGVALAALSFILEGGTYFPMVAPQARQLPPEAPPPQRRHLRLPSVESETRSEPSHPFDKSNGETLLQRRTPPAAPVEEPAPRAADLTARQVQVLVCLRRGHSNKQIARDLEMSEATVKVHVRQVMKRLGAANRTHAAVLAAQLDEPEPAAEPAAIVAYAGAARGAAVRGVGPPRWVGGGVGAARQMR